MKFIKIMEVILILSITLYLAGAELSLDNFNQISEKCYIQLNINESSVNNKTEFSLINQKNVYGIYDYLVDYYNNESSYDYIINVYDSGNKKLNSYQISSSLINFYDNFNVTDIGGAFFSNSSFISSFLLYDKRISRIIINNKGEEIDLNINVSQIKCERTCKLEGEKGKLTDKCCYGLLAVETENKSEMICVRSGDSFCSAYETYYSSEDCNESKESFDINGIFISNKDKDNDEFDLFVDCDDYNSSINPNVQEICDNIDNNCDMQIDENEVCFSSRQNSFTPSGSFGSSASSGASGGSIIPKPKTIKNISSITNIQSIFVDTDNLTQEEKAIIDEKRDNFNKFLPIILISSISIILIILLVIYILRKSVK